MNAGRVLLEARRRAQLSQRELAKRAGVPQPTVARIERGVSVPRVDTLDRLLRACNEMLEAIPLEGLGIDRSTIQRRLKLSPDDRLELATASAVNTRNFLNMAKRGS
ncbi:MAG: helix-turn-helix domain-containing protein [Dehalococcoidia bacterium]|nr:helix-turn-helix domain-containing protein [Dehalococcoidia bacterium]